MKKILSSDTTRAPHLSRVAFPLGGLGAGMLCVEGTGAFSHVSVRNKPDVFNEPLLFAAISVKGCPHAARVLEGPVPEWKIFGQANSAYGAKGHAFGLPHCATAQFTAAFPFATIDIDDPHVPLNTRLTAWSPFNEYECGHWYGRALSSYGLLQGLTGVRYRRGLKDTVPGTAHPGRLQDVPVNGHRLRHCGCPSGKARLQGHERFGRDQRHGVPPVAESLREGTWRRAVALLRHG